MVSKRGSLIDWQMKRSGMGAFLVGKNCALLEENSGAGKEKGANSSRAAGKRVRKGRKS